MLVLQGMRPVTITYPSTDSLKMKLPLLKTVVKDAKLSKLSIEAQLRHYSFKRYSWEMNQARQPRERNPVARQPLKDQVRSLLCILWTVLSLFSRVSKTFASANA